MCFEDCERRFLHHFLEETDESDDYVQDMYDKLGSESGSFGTNGTYSGVPSFNLSFFEVVEFSEN